MKSDFSKFLNGGYKGISQIRNKFPNEYNNIIKFNQNFGDIHWGQKLYNYVNNLILLPTCKCGNSVKFYKFNKGYAIYCSSKCRYEDTELKLKIKQSFLAKYGVENPLQSPEVQKKRKALFFEKHGVEHQSQLAEVKEKRKQTNLERFGTTTNLLCEDTKKKIKITNLKKFGVEHNSQCEEIKEKKKQTSLKNCGFEYNFQSSEFRKLSKVSNNEKYLKKISELLKCNVNDISVNDNIITVKKYCEKHDSFEITKQNLYSRFITYKQINFCTKCYPINDNISIKEKELKNFIDELIINNIKNSKKIINPQEIDIYIPEYKLGIELDGLYWHNDIAKDKNYHLNKTEECEKQGIQLLHIFEDEWIYKKEIVKSIIKSKLNLIENKIFGRKCIIKEIDNILSSDFLKTNHIQGFVGSKIKLGLFYNNELVSIMTFGKKRISMGNKQPTDEEYEMLRFCNKLNTSVIGGASKLLSYFIKNYQPKFILTFADRRYSNGNLYEKLGFKFIGNSRPNYWYFKQNELIRYHRFNFRKDKLVKEGYDLNKTEHQIMAEREYLSIHDCGNMKFEMKF
jgi:very-short-patch-repair endonuclease